MARHRERGFAALWILAALGLSAAVGVGVYVVMKERREVAEAEQAVEAAEASRREAETPIDAAVDGPPPFEVAASPEPTPSPPPPTVDRAEAEAVDPPQGEGSSPSNAPVFGTPGIDGALDKDAVASAARGATPKLLRCFEKSVAAGGQADGTLRVTLIVNRRGGVNGGSSVGGDEELGACAVAAFKDIRFPKTTDGGTAKVVYPIGFHPAAAADSGDTHAPIGSLGSGDGSCDEVSCVLDNYESACCAKFRRPANLPDAPSRKELMTAVTVLRVKVARCASNETFSGKLVVKLQIHPDGSTSDYVIEKVPPRVGGCIVRAFSAYTWPRSANGMAASFPFQIQLDE